MALSVRAVVRSAMLTMIVVAGANAAWSQSITTYHYDNYRTGWNSHETVLTPSNVNTSSFGMLHNVALDDQVDAQPLYMPGINITAGASQGVHNVVYVATEGNTVYAIDAQSGAVLLSVNLGTPIPFPLGCNNNGPNVGINSTPVIDAAGKTLYVMVYTQQNGSPQYMLHALDLGSLADKVAPRLVAASHKLADGSNFAFNATFQRQRPGLLLANGNVYAGFGSFCDISADQSRGWLLGWQSGTLTPLAANELFDLQVTSPDTFFLSAIWMSGYAPAADDAGNILVVTGNSDYSGTTYDGATNLQESVVKVSPDLSTVRDIFTPSNWSYLDTGDDDFGSGGVMVLPDQPGPFPHLAVAAGKVGDMFFMNEDSLGGYSSSGNNVLGTYSIGGCWCGQSYYVDPTDSFPRVVTSGGWNVEVWQVQTTATPALNLVSQSSTLPGGQDDGFFTTISSNGRNNPIIWALSRPVSSSSTAIRLFAFNPDSGSTLNPIYSGVAGAWPTFTGNANLVPVVANGQVFIASYRQLRIFGLTGMPSTSTTLSSNLNPANYGSSVTLTAQVTTSGGTTPTGTVTFKNGTTTLGTVTLDSSAVAVLTTKKLPVGSNSLTATYNGDATDAKSASQVLTQTVNQATVSLTLTSSLNPSPLGKSVKFTATFASNGGLPTGMVTFSYNGSTLGTGTITGMGTAMLSTTSLPAGSNVVSATYSGTVDYSAASGSVTQVVNATTTSLSSSANPSSYGQSVTLTAGVTTTGSTTPTGTVTFRNGSTSLGSATLNSSGIATYTTARLPLGSNSLTASYNGDTVDNKSTSPALAQVVNPATITMTLASSPNPSTSGQSVKFTATLSSTGSLPTGSVSFSFNGNVLGTANLASGKANFSTKVLPVGSDVVTATYDGNANYGPASANATQTVN